MNFIRGLLEKKKKKLKDKNVLLRFQDQVIFWCTGSWYPDC